MLDTLKKYYYNSFALDYRSIGAFRVVLAVVLILDLLIYRFPSLVELYSNAGSLSPETAKAYPDGSPFSLLYYITSKVGVQLFFLVYLILCGLMLLGYKTRYIIVPIYICLYSIQFRVSPFLYGGDDLLRVATFWAMFLPLDKRFSIESKAIDENQPNKYIGLASVAVLLQISFVYFFNAVLKSGETWSEGTAIGYAVSIFEHSAKYSHVLIENYSLSAFLTFITRAFEYAIPFLIFSPFKNEKARLMALILVFLFHYGLIPFLNVNTFYLSALPLIIILVPSYMWNMFYIKSIQEKHV